MSPTHDEPIAIQKGFIVGYRRSVFLWTFTQQHEECVCVVGWVGGFPYSGPSFFTCPSPPPTPPTAESDWYAIVLIRDITCV